MDPVAEGDGQRTDAGGGGAEGMLESAIATSSCMMHLSCQIPQAI